MKYKIFVLFILGLTIFTSSSVHGLARFDGEIQTPLLLSFIDDNHLFGSPEQFDVQTFLYNQPGPMKDYSENNDGFNVSASTAIDFYSEIYGIDPRVILTLIEVQSGALSKTDITNQEISACFNNQRNNETSLFTQLKWGLDSIIKFYDEMLGGEDESEIVLSCGQRISLPQNTNPAAYAVMKFLSLNATCEQWNQFVSSEPGSYLDTYSFYFGLNTRSILEDSTETRALSGLGLPWGNGETWYYTGGPHAGSAGGVRYYKAAIDFAPGGGSGCFTSNTWVRAAKAGKVVYANCNFVRIDHGGGWSTGYFHLSSIQVSVGQNISAGAILGHPSCGTGQSCGWVGRATGSHVHFDTRINNKPQQIAGTSLDGWVVGVGSSDYKGTLTLGSNIKIASVYKTGNNAVKANAYNTDPDDTRTLTSGQTLSGTINPINDIDVYYIHTNAGQQITIDMMKTSTSSLDTYLSLKDPDGQIIGVDDDGGVGYNSRLVKVLSKTGRHEIHARGFGTSTGAYNIKAVLQSVSADSEDGTWLNSNQTFSGVLNQNNDRDTFYFSGVANRIVSIKMWKNNSNLDSFVELYNPSGEKIHVNDDGLGNRDSWLVVLLPDTGVYRVVARSYNYLSKGGYKIQLNMITTNNYALNKFTLASSYQSGFSSPGKAVDGDTVTHWRARPGEPQWIMIYLGSSKEIDTATIEWGLFHHAIRFGVFAWNGWSWQNIYSTNNGRHGTVIMNFTPVNANWVMIKFYDIWDDTGAFGLAIKEIGVYNSALATQPIVNPEDDQKEPDSVSIEPPPSATSPEKDGDLVLALTAGETGGQEFSLVPSTFTEEIPMETISEIDKPLANIEAIFFDDTLAPDALKRIDFYGLANDSDFEGVGDQITEYEWSSSLDGILSQQPSFSTISTDLSEGTHTISFRAKDNEGYWSDYSTMELIIDYPAFFTKTYLPIIVN